MLGNIFQTHRLAFISLFAAAVSDKYNVHVTSSYRDALVCQHVPLNVIL